LPLRLNSDATTVTVSTRRFTDRDRPGADLDDVDGLAVADERDVVFLQGMQDQLHADEPQDGRQTVGPLDQPVEKAVDEEVELPQTQRRELTRQC
jgi:hypothetical protein